MKKYQFGDQAEVKKAMAANRTFERALKLDYSYREALALARQAKKEVSDFETPEQIAQRLAPPRTIIRQEGDARQ